MAVNEGVYFIPPVKPDGTEQDEIKIDGSPFYIVFRTAEYTRFITITQEGIVESVFDVESNEEISTGWMTHDDIAEVE